MFSPTRAENVVAVITLGIICVIQAIVLCVMRVRVWEQQDHQQSDTRNSTRPADAPQNERTPANTDTAHQSTKKSQHYAKEQLFWRRQIIAAWALNVLTFLAAGVAIGGLWVVNKSIEHADQGNIDANRAWLEASGIEATGNITGKDDLALKVYYANLGKSPATGFVQNFEGTPFQKAGQNYDYDAVHVGQNTTCNGLMPTDDGIVVFPNPTRAHWINSVFYRKGIPPQTGNDPSIGLYMTGCFAYRTMQQIHFTWFCFVVYRNKQLATMAASNECADGQGAN